MGLSATAAALAATVSDVDCVGDVLDAGMNAVDGGDSFAGAVRIASSEVEEAVVDEDLVVWVEVVCTVVVVELPDKDGIVAVMIECVLGNAFFCPSHILYAEP